MFKSPRRCQLRSLWLSRQQWKRKAQQLLEENRSLQRQLQQGRQQLHVAGKQCSQASRRAHWLTEQLKRLTPPAAWQPLRGHRYSAEMIALCCRLAQIIGCRAVPKVLQCVGQELGIAWEVPTRDAIRNWLCRSGVALLQQPQPADDWIWMIDHSVQLGKMCVLLVLGIRQSQLPVGRPLVREDMNALAVLPSASRDKAEVTAHLRQLAEHLGTPRVVVSDGASELRAAVEQLSVHVTERPAAGPLVRPIHIDDMKHKISNLLKRSLARDERFVHFSALAGRTASHIRQTELDHLQPPRRKDKCRFMNIGRESDWAQMALAEVDRVRHDNSEQAKRLRDKLGWITQFRESIGHWHECRQIISAALQFANSRGVAEGLSDQFEQQLRACRVQSPLAVELREGILASYRHNQAKLASLPQAMRRMPCSSEVLESAFGSYKAMQRHHIRGTFTTLLAALPTLFDCWTAEKIRERFRCVDNRQLQRWYQEHGLTNSSQSRRTKAYAAVTA